MYRYCDTLRVSYISIHVHVLTIIIISIGTTKAHMTFSLTEIQQLHIVHHDNLLHVTRSFDLQVLSISIEVTSGSNSYNYYYQ